MTYCGLWLVGFKVLDKVNALLELDIVLTLWNYEPSFVLCLIFTQIANILTVPAGHLKSVRGQHPACGLDITALEPNTPTMHCETLVMYSRKTCF